MSTQHIILCPGQGAQAVGMGRGWFEKSPAAKAVFDEADRVLATSPGGSGGAKLSETCFNGPAERLNQTDVSQPAIYTVSVACWRGLLEKHGALPLHATAGLSLGEYTALHIADVFDFATGLKLVAERGRLMQVAAVASKGGMIALIGAEDEQAQAVCDKALAAGAAGPLVCANFNAPGQIVLSGSAAACERAVAIAGEMGLKAAPLTVAGAFHSPLMQPAADRMAEVLARVDFRKPVCAVWSNVTAQPHSWENAQDGGSGGGVGNGGGNSGGAGVGAGVGAGPNAGRWAELMRQRLVEQIIRPVKWAQTCAALGTGLGSGTITGEDIEYHELAPGTVLRGLMRRIDRNRKVMNHDQPED